jgi:GntR family transcriptional repressor for pyruvate dehydrogenase complex
MRYTLAMERSNQRTAAFPAKPIRPRRTFEDVISQLREAMLGRRLSVGDRLPNERDLAASFEISRQSLREGLRMLEALGILAARRGAGPDSGWTVTADASGLSVLLDLYTSLQRTPLWDMLEIREALEMRSARSAAVRASEAEKADLVAAALAMCEVTERGEFLKADTEFHVAIARASGNGLAPLFMESIRESIRRTMLLAIENLPDWPAEREILMREHVEIARAIAASDGDGAARLLSEHIRGFYGRALREDAAASDAIGGDILETLGA